ncbi:beta-carotene isomerase d27 chloroplastic [Phtheirospermum japonicum]|uniref:Beta-carotene isomerase d27 chloroplastic n=1 Tax=Phtheirospermum japonicum TaxID=374723 RepID=A0A830CQ76_9LAMI|nr:beta-carotene isomerase d27 chloroplastic [Phtheirospermum japonicum]
MQNRKRSPFILSELKDKDLNKSHESKSVYNDNWIHSLAINHLSHSLQASTGHKSKKSGYDGLVEAARMVHRNFSPTQQRVIIRQSLDLAAPRPILNLMRALMPPSKGAREKFAVMTTLFFSWLVGPCEVRESDCEGGKEKNVVYIPKCRFLEETNCVGMCTNLCKMPSQEFIKETLGTPVNMVPNFDDMSCEMIFGQEPPAQSLDPAFAQPCYKQCNSFLNSYKKLLFI